MKKLYSLMALVTIVMCASGQTTYQSVYNILQTNCTGSCHTSGNPNNLVLTGSPQQVFNALVNVAPVNGVAQSLGNREVDPGNPRNSFLFAKLSHGLDANLTLQSGEGMAMPDSINMMSQVDRELVRQWILFGAQDTGTFVDSMTIVNFYIGQGGFPRQTPLAPPAPGTGQQLYWGPVFVKPGIEIQYGNNTYINNNTAIDISHFISQDNPEAHHFAIFKYYPGRDTLHAKGLIAENSISDVASLWFDASVVAQYPKNMDMDFPAGTAIVWDSATVLQLTYHMINYTDSIVAAEGYLNMYYTPHQQSTTPINTQMVVYNYPNVGALVIPNNGLDTTFRINQYSPDSAFYWNVISILGHTHKLGVGYNVWTRNAAGAKDSLIYNGDYDPSYTFNQGVYTWNDPPYRKCEPIFPVDMRKGFIHEATFNNSGASTVTFGVHTTDEMFITFIMYYKSEFPTGITNENTYVDENVKVYPNPVRDEAFIKITSVPDISDAEFQVFDIVGNLVADVKGISDVVFQVNLGNLASGAYTYRLLNGGSFTGTGKRVVQR